MNSAKIDISFIKIPYLNKTHPKEDLETCCALFFYFSYIQKVKSFKICKDFFEKAGESLGISSRSVRRYVVKMDDVGFSYTKDGTWNLFSVEKVFKNISIKHIPVVAILEVNDEWKMKECIMLLRFLRMKEREFSAKRRICSNMIKSQKRLFSNNRNKQTLKFANMFCLYENDKSSGKPQMVATVRAEIFSKMYSFFTRELEYREVLGLEQKILIEQARGFLHKQYDVDKWKLEKAMTKDIGVAEKSEKIGSIEEYLKQRHINRGVISAEEEDMEWVEELATSRGLTKHEVELLIDNSGDDSSPTSKLQKRSKSLNKSDLSAVNDSIFMHSFQFRSLSGTMILSPLQYFTTICCDFGLEYRSGLTALSKSLCLSKSQTSRTLSELNALNFIKYKRRFVYICKVKNYKEYLKAREKYRLLFLKNPRNESVGILSRLVIRHGCLLYEIESDKDEGFLFYIMKIGRLNDTKKFKSVFSEFFLLENTNEEREKYPKLKEKIYNGDKTVLAVQK